MAVFEGLAQHLEHAAVKLGQFVAEEHAIVCQTYLTRLRIGATTHEGHRRDGVVRAAEGAHGYERGILAEATCHGVYLGGLQALMKR